MRLLEFFTRLDMTRLDELFIRYKTPGEQADFQVIAHRENVWLFTRDDMDNERLVADVQQRTGLDGEDLDDLSQQATERGDVIAGTYNPGQDSFWHQGDPGMMTHNPAVSAYFKKLIEFLDVNWVNGNRFSGMDDVEVQTHRSDMHGKIPDVLHHGTNTGAMDDILKRGLVPGAGEGNWGEQGVEQFHDLIFLTEDFYNAKFHAERQSSNINGVAPVILKVRVPDQSKIVPDFDVLTQMGGNPEMADQLNYSGNQHYYNDRIMKQREEIAKHNPGSDLTMISGIVAYQGRIPANHIIEVIADLSGEMGDPDSPDYTDFNSIEDFTEALNIYNEFGYWYWGMQDEFQDEQEDDE